VSVPADQAEARVAAALEAGGRLADGTHVPQWWTLASPENHGVDIAAWPDFEDDEEG
jgi:4a-hydroxytetrahydrobiopterin dehydratase